MGWCIYIGRDTGRDGKKVKWSSENGQEERRERERKRKKQTGNILKWFNYNQVFANTDTTCSIKHIYQP